MESTGQRVRQRSRAGGAPGQTDVQPYRVLVTCHFFEPGFRGGGPIRSVARLVDTTPDGVELILLTNDRDLGSPRAYPGLSGCWTRRLRARVYYLNPRHPGQLWRLWRHLRRIRFDLLYVNSLWSTYSIVPILAVRLGLLRAEQILLAPQGELAAGALARKAWKKRPFLRLWAPVLRGLRVRWHATSDLEATGIRAACRWARIRTSPPPVALPMEPLPPPPPHDGPLRLVSISRIHESKNLKLALTALATVAHPVDLDIFGPIEDQRYWAGCRSLIAALPPHVRVTYRGELPAAEVRPAFHRYDAFVFPTLGESFGHAVSESLSVCCPVLCSATTPWTDVLGQGGGVVVQPLTAPAFAVALARVAAFRPVERHRARLAAGEAYRRWRAGADVPHILDQMRADRLTSAAAPR